MRRDSRVLLMAVVESADAIADAVNGVSFDDYCNSRLIRAAVEREFITIGEALNNLSRVDSGVFARIDQAVEACACGSGLPPWRCGREPVPHQRTQL